MQKINLYGYQESAVTHATQMLAERLNSLIVAGTGAGKTVMLAAVIGKFFYGFQSANGRKPHILVLVHRTEIHGQNHKKFSLVCPEIPTSEVTATRKSLHGYVHFGMVQTVAGLLTEFERAGSFFDLIVIDECHHSAASTYESIITWNKTGKPNACLFGVTATPNRGDQLPLVHLFDNFIQITTRFLINSHYLVRPTFIDCSPEFSVEKKKGKTVEITVEKGHLSKNCKMDAPGLVLISRLCGEYLERKADGKSVIFAPSHEFCEAIYKELSARGRTPAYLSLGLADDLRHEELERFERGDAEELINVDIATEGYDYPPIRNVVEFDTNGTHGQWVQKVGRGLRTCEGKVGCTVIDFGGNIDLYPQGVETDVDLDGVTKNPKGVGISEEDLFREPQEKSTAQYVPEIEEATYTPYHVPKGFETVSDKTYGIVFVSCGEKRDCIVVKSEAEGRYKVLLGDKKKIWLERSGDFSDCIKTGINWCGEVEVDEQKAISRLQARLLAPEFPTGALTWHGANCCICW
ncbi:MAG: DEAD/DEAH box helicase family protein, partial [Dehalobacterium sp.]